MTAERPGQDDALDAALRELRQDVAAGPGEPEDRYWLRAGLALALGRPGQARLLLERLEAGVASGSERAGERPAADVAEAAADARDEAPADPGAESTAGGRPDAVPVRSMLLARAAVLPLDEPHDTAFGWATRLRADEVTLMGRIVGDQLAAGGPVDLARGFGLAWMGGARIPHAELNGLFGRFTELEITVAGVLAGHDMRGIPSPKGMEGISAAIQNWFMPRRSAADGAMTAVFEQLGVPAQRGLVAAWNAWAALRFRDQVPPTLFDQLVHPWTTVIGPLPEA